MGQSITDIALFWRSSFRNFKIKETIPNKPKSCPKICDRLRPPRMICCCCSQAKSKSDLHTCEIYGFSSQWNGDICHYYAPNVMNEWTIHQGTLSFHSSIWPINSDNINVVSATHQLECVWLRWRYEVNSTKIIFSN